MRIRLASGVLIASTLAAVSLNGPVWAATWRLGQAADGASEAPQVAPVDGADVLQPPAMATTGGAAPTDSGPTGLSGRVLLTMRCDVPIGDDSDNCSDRAFPTTLVVWSGDGLSRLAEVPTDAGGNFSIALNPGNYLVDAPVAGGSPAVTHAVAISVMESGVTQMTIRVPTGRAPPRQP